MSDTICTLQLPAIIVNVTKFTERVNSLVAVAEKCLDPKSLNKAIFQPLYLLPTAIISDDDHNKDRERTVDLVF